jgi:undecaprenyl diphosphate synthase
MDHIAFIMDGNRRWADKEAVSRVSGHKEGIFAMERAIRGCIKHDIKYITFYAFSEENWRREPFELRYMMKLMYRYLRIIYNNKLQSNLYNRVAVVFIGNKEVFSDRLQNLMQLIERRVLPQTDCSVAIAVSYSGQQEIVRAVNLALTNGVRAVNKNDIQANLYASEFPDPDFIVRTSGVMRLSNFLTWQSIYSEILFYSKMWPEITEDDISAFVCEYNKRDRKFGR